MAADRYDAFLSHATPDKEWVRALADAMTARGLAPYFDARELEPADNFVTSLGDGLRRSRFLVLVLTRVSADRLWVVKEWTTFMSIHGPHGRVIPVLLDGGVELPDMLKTCQGVFAADREVERVATELARRIGRADEVPEGDARGLYIGQDLVFHLQREADGQVRVIGPDGRDHTVAAPLGEVEFGQALLAFRRLSRKAAEIDATRADLERAATAVGTRLAGVLFSDECRDILRRATVPGAPRPLVTIRSDDDSLLSLPWELLRDEDRFLVRDGVIDLARSSPKETHPHPAATGPFTLVVNVSAPGDRSDRLLDYEHESYRITRVLEGRCVTTPTELGTLDDLAETVKSAAPRGVHFSGHGGPGVLIFENDVGGEDKVPVGILVARLREVAPGGRLPPFCYLACCYGNDPGDAAAESTAARLHDAGVDQVVGYHGPIVDELSTRAEEAVYGSLAAGHPTRFAVRQARSALLRPFDAEDDSTRGPGAAEGLTGNALFPFAWAQLVYYHRGLDSPLSVKPAEGEANVTEVPLQRRFRGGDERILQDGFIGRRREMHAIRKRVKSPGPDGRVFVFQGFGGLGKSTLQFQMPKLLKIDWADVCILWCADAAAQGDLLQGLAKQLSDWAEKRFGAAEWTGVIQAVDRAAGNDGLKRFEFFMQVVLQNTKRILVVADNLESLLTGPTALAGERPDPKAFGEWKTAAAKAWWRLVRGLAERTGNLWVAASTRYQHPDYADVQLEVADLPPDAVFRLMRWHADLRKLAVKNRAELLKVVAGHPRAVQFLNDLVRAQFVACRRKKGEWTRPTPASADDLEREWVEIVEPALPKVRDKLWADLLLGELWDRVFDEKMRRMLYRMTLLRQPWTWDLVPALGEPDEPATSAEATADEISRTSLLIREEFPKVGAMFTLHPTTKEFVRSRFPGGDALRLDAHLRIGSALEELVKTKKYVEIRLEAGHHLFWAEEYDRAYELLVLASEWLQNRGRAAQALVILELFLPDVVTRRMSPRCVMGLLRQMANAVHSLGRIEEGIQYSHQRLDIASEIGDRASQAEALGTLGLMYAYFGRLVEGAEYIQRQLVLARELGDRRREAQALGGLGLAHTVLGRYEESAGYIEQGLAILREVGDRRGEAAALGSLGDVYKNLGKLPEAVECFERQLTIAREESDRRGEAIGLHGLGDTLHRVGRRREAVQHFDQELAIRREIGDRRGEAAALQKMGRVFASSGLREEAIGYYERQLAIAREIGDREGEASALSSLGSTYSQLRRWAEAIRYHQLALAILRAISDRQLEGIAVGQLADAYFMIGKVEEAVKLAEEGLVIAREVKDARIITLREQQLARFRSGGPPPADS